MSQGTASDLLSPAIVLVVLLGTVGLAGPAGAAMGTQEALVPLATGELAPGTGGEPAASASAVGVTQTLRDQGITGEGVTIALLDTGIDASHPALADRVLAELQVGPDGVHPTSGSGSDEDHGTPLAGVLVGTGAGGGPAGVAPGADLVSLDLSSSFTTGSALKAFQWIEENHERYGIQVVSNSWGRTAEDGQYDPDDAVLQAASRLVDEGLVVVFSSGNQGPVPGQMTLESMNPDVLTVGATGQGDEVASFSGRGPVRDASGNALWTKPDLVAPGTAVVSTQTDSMPGNPSYGTMDGTSVAAPHAAGAAALLLSVQPDLTPEEVRALLLAGARDVGPVGVDADSGHGMLNVTRSIELLQAQATPELSLDPASLWGSSTPETPAVASAVSAVAGVSPAASSGATEEATASSGGGPLQPSSLPAWAAPWVLPVTSVLIPLLIGAFLVVLWLTVRSWRRSRTATLAILGLPHRRHDDPPGPWSSRDRPARGELALGYGDDVVEKKGEDRHPQTPALSPGPYP